MMLILLLSVASAFLDALQGDVLQTYSILAGVILASLYFITFLLLCMVLTAFFYRAAMGSSEELAVLTLGKAPSTTSLVGGLEALCQAVEQADFHFLSQTIGEFNVYDRRMLASVLTTLAPFFDDDDRLRLLHQLRVSNVSLSTYASERNSGSQKISVSEKGQVELANDAHYAESLQTVGI